MKKIQPSKNPKDFNFRFDKSISPIATVKPGETIIVETMDNTGNQIHTEEYRGKGYWGPFNPITYPIFIEGARKGDTLVIDIREVEPLGGNGWLSQYEGSSTFASSTYIYPNLLPPLPTRIKFLSVRNLKADFPLLNGMKMPLDLRPMIGTIGTTPELETPASMLPGNHGGNMDSRNCSKGNRLYLPVFVEGALLGLGDVHAIQGQGELGSMPLEVPAECTLTINVIKGKTIPRPRIENEEYIMTVGNNRPLDDAVRMAIIDLLYWVRDDYGLDIWEEANMLLTLVDEIEINQVGAPIYSVSVKWPKKYLPKRQAPG
jgi:amidase